MGVSMPWLARKVLDAAAQEAVLKKLAKSTRQSCGKGWKQWALFMSGTGTTPQLVGESRHIRLQEEQSGYNYPGPPNRLLWRTLGLFLGLRMVMCLFPCF